MQCIYQTLWWPHVYLCKWRKTLDGLHWENLFYCESWAGLRLYQFACLWFIAAVNFYHFYSYLNIVKIKNVFKCFVIKKKKMNMTFWNVWVCKFMKLYLWKYAITVTIFSVNRNMLIILSVGECRRIILWLSYSHFQVHICTLFIFSQKRMNFVFQ